MGDTTAKASCWSITINNPTEDDRNRLNTPPDWVKETHLQDEIGADGTLHIQGCLLTTQCRFSQVKKYLPRAHIEVARSKQALLKYVKKADTAVEGTQKVIQGEYVSMQKALEMIAKEKRDSNFELDFDKYMANPDKEAKREYWAMVNRILVDRPEIVSILTDARVERAWIHTRGVWLTKLDRQTDRQEGSELEESGPRAD